MTKEKCCKGCPDCMPLSYEQAEDLANAMEGIKMSELKLSEIPGLLPKKVIDPVAFRELHAMRNSIIDELSTKNLLDYVEAVVCEECGGSRVIMMIEEPFERGCPYCRNTGAIIRVKESK